MPEQQQQQQQQQQQEKGPFPLKDTVAYSTISMEESTLKEFIRKNSHALRELTFSGSVLGGSIGVVIANKFGGGGDDDNNSSSSSSMLGRTAGGCDFHTWQFDGDDDDDEGAFGAAPPDLVTDSDAGSDSSSSSSSSTSSSAGQIELAPGVERTLKSCDETWQAIRDGRTIKTKCSFGDCSTDLHCIEDADFVICPDCWTASLVEQAIGGIAFEFDEGVKSSSSGEGIAIGIREGDVVQWLEDN